MKGRWMMDFLKNFDTASSVPAGGAAAAYCFCLAVGLVNKVVIIESHRENHSPEIERDITGDHMKLITRREITKLGCQ